jgi:hypothetical protein
VDIEKEVHGAFAEDSDAWAVDTVLEIIIQDIRIILRGDKGMP